MDMDGGENVNQPSGAVLGPPTPSVVSSPSAPSDPSSSSWTSDRSPHDQEAAGTEHFEAAVRGLPVGCQPPMVITSSASDHELQQDQESSPAEFEAAAAFKSLLDAGARTDPMRSALDDEESVSSAPEEPAVVLAAPDTIFRRVHRGCASAPFIACFVVVVVLAFAAVLALKATVSRRGSSAEGNGSHFCCPDEVKALVRYVNASLEPCDSFFEFVCSNAALRKMRNVSIVFPPLLGFNTEMTASAIMTASGSRSQVSAFLRSMFDSCLHSGADQNAVVGKLAAFLVSTSGAYLRDGGTTNLLAYLLLSNLKYRIPSVVAVTLRGLSAFSIALRPHLDLTNHQFQHCLNVSLEKFNFFALKYVRAAEVNSFASSLEARYPASVKVELYARGNLSMLLHRWDIRKALEVISIGLNNVSEVSVNGTDQMHALFDALTSAEEGVRDAGASYLLACSVYNGLVELAWPAVHSKSNRLLFCMRQIELTPSIRDIMYADEFITKEKQFQVTRVANAVIDAIQTDRVVRSIFTGTDRARLQTFFDSMALIRPWESARPAIMETRLTQSFLERILDGRAYDFEAQLRLARWELWTSSGAERSAGSRPYVSLLNGADILISPVIYAFIRIDAAHTDVFNTPIIPWSLAESIWRFLLSETAQWSDLARRRIKELVGCFRERYLTGGMGGLSMFSEVDIVAASLGLSSVLSCFYEPLWNKVEAAGSFWSLSHSQYFYIRETFYRCPASADLASRSYVDVPVMHAGGFPRNFQCESSKHMAKMDTCKSFLR